MHRISFIATFWGEAYRQRFLDLCLSSFCSTDSLQSLVSSAGHRLVIVCGPSDWKAIKDHPLVELVGQHLEVTWLELKMPAPPWLAEVWRKHGENICGRATETPSADGFLIGERLDALYSFAETEPGFQHVDRYQLTIYAMSQGHLKALDFVMKVGGYASFLAPDMVFSAGSVATLVARASDGVQLLLAAANRFTYRAVEELKEHGLLKAGAPSDLPPRDLVQICFANQHPETREFEFDKPDFCCVATCMSFRIPDDGGLAMHSMFWAPLLVSEEQLKRADHGLLSVGGTTDGPFLADMTDDDWSQVRVIQDSDELFLASFTDQSNYGYVNNPAWYKKQPPLSTLYKLTSIHATLYGPSGNALKRMLYPKTVVFHSADVTPMWRPVLERAEKLAIRASKGLSLGGHLMMPFVLLTRPDRANLRLTDYGLFRIGRIRFLERGFPAKLVWALKHPFLAASILRRKLAVRA